MTTETMRGTRGRRAIACAAMAVVVAIGLGGCWRGPGSGEDDAAALESRVAKMHVHEGVPKGATPVHTSSSGRLWVMVPREDSRHVAPAKCAIDGIPLERPKDDLAFPESMVAGRVIELAPQSGDEAPEPDAEKTDAKAEIFAFGEGRVDKESDVNVYCDLSHVDDLYVVFESQ